MENMSSNGSEIQTSVGQLSAWFKSLDNHVQTFKLDQLTSRINVLCEAGHDKTVIYTSLLADPTINKFVMGVFLD